MFHELVRRKKIVKCDMKSNLGHSVILSE